jgi:hypothetical protein
MPASSAEADPSSSANKTRAKRTRPRDRDGNIANISMSNRDGRVPRAGAGADGGTSDSPLNLQQDNQVQEDLCVLRRIARDARHRDGQGLARSPGRANIDLAQAHAKLSGSARHLAPNSCVMKLQLDRTTAIGVPEIILAGRRLNDSMGAFVPGEVVKLMAARAFAKPGAILCDVKHIFPAAEVAGRL